MSIAKNASVLKRSTRADCKSAGIAYGGSNPPRRTTTKEPIAKAVGDFRIVAPGRIRKPVERDGSRVVDTTKSE